jgi:CBS-domain-containing membrane protein
MRSMLLLKRWLGVELDPVSLKEKAVSALGGMVAMGCVLMTTQSQLGLTGGSLVIASMAASAVLLFAVPQGQLSQPWPVLAGHVVSAVIGVFCARNISHLALAGALAVGASIAAMHVFKCIHPPGGATALTAVIGGAGVRDLGYSFLWNPVLLQATLLVVLAVALNGLFRWRRYPAFWHRHMPPEPGDISHDEVVSALESFDSFVDITEDDLIRLHRILSRRVQKKPIGSRANTALEASADEPD